MYPGGAQQKSALFERMVFRRFGRTAIDKNEPVELPSAARHCDASASFIEIVGFQATERRIPVLGTAHRAPPLIAAPIIRPALVRHLAETI